MSLNLNPMVLGLIKRHMSSWTRVGATDVTMTYYDYILNYTRCIDLKYPELVLLSRLIFDRYLARNVKGVMMDNKTRKKVRAFAGRETGVLQPQVSSELSSVFVRSRVLA